MRQNLKMIVAGFLASLVLASGEKSSAIEISSNKIAPKQAQQAANIIQPAAKRRATVTVGKLELRAAPSPSSTPVASLVTGTVFEASDEVVGTDQKNWLKGRTQDGAEGWFPAHIANVVLIPMQGESVFLPALVSNGSNALKAYDKEYESARITGPEENTDSRIEINYKDTPVTVPVSRDQMNVIRLPYQLKFVDTSKEGIKEIGKTEYEISLSVLKDQETELVIFTTEKTYILILAPTKRKSTLVVVKDMGNSKKAEETEKAHPYVDTMRNLIASSINGALIEGYASVPVSEVYETPDAIFVLKKESRGTRYKVVVIDVINKTKDVLQLREDSKFVKNIISKITGQRPRASSVTREFLQPRNSETERKGEFVSTIHAVVDNI